MKASLLLVDDDPLFLHATVALMRVAHPDWSLRTANNGLEALEALEEDTYDAVISDINMPLMGGVELIAELREMAPQIPVILMSSEPSEEIRIKLERETNLTVFTKPLVMDELAAAIDTILTRGVHGEIKGVSLQGYLQLIAYERRSMVLNLETETSPGIQSNGLLFLQGGDVIDAKFGPDSGRVAALKLLATHPTRIEILRGHRLRDRVIHDRLDALLFESLRQADKDACATVVEDFVYDANDLSIIADDPVMIPEQFPSEVTMKLDTAEQLLKAPGIRSAHVIAIATGEVIFANAAPRQTIERNQYLVQLGQALAPELGFDRMTSMTIVGKTKTLLYRCGAQVDVGVETDPQVDAAALMRSIETLGV
ncbi:MAG: response regulator [Clostridia bacterium]|nr:response regulator [Deltaproteobacteria bacterium]